MTTLDRAESDEILTTRTCDVRQIVPRTPKSVVLLRERRLQQLQIAASFQDILKPQVSLQGTGEPRTIRRDEFPKNTRLVRDAWYQAVMQRPTETVVKSGMKGHAEVRCNNAVPHGLENLPDEIPEYEALITLIQEQTSPPARWAEVDGDEGVISSMTTHCSSDRPGACTG